MKAMLMLEDGSSFAGEVLGNLNSQTGEVILNTAVVGYQEMLTDPANTGKILVLTYPLIGNYGVAPKFNESTKCWLSGLVIKESSKIYSNWQAKESFDAFVQAQKLAVLTGVDTRSLAVHLRNKGEMRGMLAPAGTGMKELTAKLKSSAQEKQDYLAKASSVKPRLIKKARAKYRLAVLDLGLTNSIVKQLEGLGCQLHIFPYAAKPSEILRDKPQGLIISNGPEEDSNLAQVISSVKSLVGKIPILGISTGHQVLAAALGAKITKMKLGHRGVNYPMYHPSSYKAEITAQNHGVCVDVNSLNRLKAVKITGYNLNDRTVEEIESKKLKLIGIQYLPVSPGFGEANTAIKKFLKILRRK